MVSELVGDDVLRRQVARRAELVLQLHEEVEVDVQPLVGRAVERPGLRRSLAAPGAGRAGEEHHHGVLVGLAERRRVLGGPEVLGVVVGAAQGLFELRLARPVAGAALGLPLVRRRQLGAVAVAVQQAGQEDDRRDHQQAEQAAAGLHRESHRRPCRSPGTTSPATPCPRRSSTRPASVLRILVILGGPPSIARRWGTGPPRRCVPSPAFDAHGAGTDQRAAVAEPGRRDARAARCTASRASELSSSWAALKNVAREPEGDAAAHHDQLEVEQVAQRCRRPDRRAARCAA